ncbi:16S rRNA (cytidine(1402)-2'-O)-methyltransferase [Planktotalea arctica]|uniref:16S rRNA (cytidine(1402)-2'-O)-methyltransferase n=1 Tax=Planktotalea arctica TaxID=1481893 RepID=UPI000A176363|nr:16S rRNA (cytidine(1402)-2'-O)-methyltransferase [Planktotalea arctica]
MNAKTVKLDGGLYFVATPIGTARDITLRALDIFASADVLAAEDTRSLRRLMDIHGIALGDRPLLSYHDHNGARVRPKLMQYLAEGRSIAYASEAGTPLIADPGYDLSKEVAEQGYLVTSAPGPTAVATALTLAGLPTDKFLFAGFLPNSKAARISAIEALRDVPATLVFYESPKRIGAMLADCAATLGDRRAAMCRELTKKFEEIRRGTLNELCLSVKDAPPKGEIVVVIDRAGQSVVNVSDLEADLRDALGRMSVRDASEMVAGAHGMARRKVYQMALGLDRADEDG